MDARKVILFRIYFLFACFMIVAMVLIGRVFKIGIIEGEKWRSEGDSLYVKRIPLEAERGNILSDDGSFLAASLQFFDIRVDFNSTAMTDEIFRTHIDSLAICMSKWIDPGQTPTQYKNLFITKRQEGSRSLLLKRKATYKELVMMKKFPLLREGRYKGGLVIEPRVERIKPFQHLASRTIGEFRKNAQMVGLEGFYDEALRGQEGSRLCYEVSSSACLPFGEESQIDPKPGHDIKSTINIGIQDVAQSALLKALEHHDAEYGVAIVMEVNTGAVKAIANLRKTTGGGYAEIYNDAVGTRIEPGSTIKLATMMSLLEDDKLDLDEIIEVGYGEGYFCSRRVQDSEPHAFKETTARHAFEISSNVGMARLVTEKYKRVGEEQSFVDNLRKFHLDKATGIQIKGEATPYIKNAHDKAQSWSCLSLPWMSFGYEMALTPLQIIAFYNAVANDGKYMKPYLVSEILENRKTIHRFDPIVLDEAIAKHETIEAAQKLLRGVMINGTGRKMKLPFAVAGKTGTSQINYTKREEKTKYQSAFVGYFPADNPKFTCIVIINEPTKHGYYGSQVAGPVFQEIALKCMNRVHDSHAEIDEQKGEYPWWSVTYRQDIENVLDEMDMKYEKWTDSDYVVLVPENDSLELKTRAIPKDQVPNVVSMPLKDALYVLENNGFIADVSGIGRVTSQKPEAGAKVDQDLRIELTLE